MLELHNILWLIPGVIFIHFYNNYRPEDTISLSGWNYIFSLVVIAFLTWFPAEWIIECYYREENISEKSQKGMTVLVSILFAFILFWIVRLIGGTSFIKVQDNFYKKCIEWENVEILLTLKNGKIYQGLLWKYPESPKSRHESQTISIVPFKSGYRENETKKVIWNTYYPEYEKDSDLIDMEIIIPRAEIITFGKFSIKTFEHFEKQRTKSEERK